MCMIVRDEENNVGYILRDIYPFADEVIIVDTGSRDGTKQVVKDACKSARIFDYVWTDSFSAARNFSIAQATCDHIMILDADDRMDLTNAQKVVDLKSKMDGQTAFLFYVDNPGFYSPSAIYRQVRVFPNLPGLRYRGRAHNEIMSAIEASGIKVEETDIFIEHRGYPDAETIRRKHDRTFAILSKEYEECKDDPRVTTYLGMHMLERQRTQEAIDYFLKTVALLEEKKSQKPWGLYIAYSNLAIAYSTLGNQMEASRWWKEFAQLVAGHQAYMQEAAELAEMLDLWEGVMRCA